ncbi:MAG: hypothetical protein HUU41_20305, partial [Bryobacteraceae bacterium]|nr:hypothetical protein [Bryobacteraceae bacterium]
MTARELFQAGRLNESVQALGAELRKDPTDTRRRTFLFELLCFAGEYERAEKQLDILASEKKESDLGALLYRAAIHAERTRNEMFSKRDFPSGRAPDATTLIIHTKKPDPNLPARLAFYGGQIVPEKHLKAVGPQAFGQRPVGTGPVRFVSWTKDDRTVLEANPDYWGGRIDADRVIIRAIPEMAPRVAALLKGEADLITQLPPDHGERVTGNAA